MDLSQEQKQKLESLARMVVEANLVMNLTAHADFETMWARHVEDSLAAAPYLREMAQSGTAASLIDIGSGAGFPGLALAIVLPDWRITSLEATQKKARFQEQAIAELGLANVRIISDRAETLAHDPKHRARYSAATARALAALPVLAELALPFVRVGGSAIAWKGPRAGEEIAISKAACAELGATFKNMIPYRLTMPAEELPEFNLVIMQKERRTPDLYPRQMAIIKKKSLA